MTEPSQALAGLSLLLALVPIGRAGMGRKLAARPAVSPSAWDTPGPLARSQATELSDLMGPPSVVEGRGAPRERSHTAAERRPRC
jgi:hypothetical protein